MKSRAIFIAAASFATLASAAASAQVAPGRTPMAPTPAAAPTPPPAPRVGGVEMLPTRTIAENAALAPNLTTLVAAASAADLVATLAGPGPFTVFAPTNEAFGRLAPGTVDNLLKPENKPALTKVLTYHVVPGALTGEALQAQIAAAGGTLALTTVQGAALTASLTNGAITLTDVNGNKSYIEQYDVKQSNGVVHVVNGVLIPKL